MGERKVLNKYFPPDFDPAKVPRRKQPKHMQMTVRMMLPMSIRCNMCGSYMSRGTKLNSRKEDYVGETYLGIPMRRLYFNCSGCCAELTMKTDPKSAYAIESGAPWRAADEALDAVQSKREAEEMGDAMKALENRTTDSTQDMDIMAALDEIKSMRALRAIVGTTEMLEALSKTSGEKRQKDLAEEEEALWRSVKFQTSIYFVRRVEDDEVEEELEGELQQQERK